MDNKIAFKLAHEMTKKVIKDGDSYQATFGACLKHIKAQANKPKIQWLNIIDKVCLVFCTLVFVALLVVLLMGAHGLLQNDYPIASFTMLVMTFGAGFIGFATVAKLVPVIFNQPNKALQHSF